MDQEEAPPPYSAVDPLLTQANNNRRNANSPQGPIAGSVPGTEYASSSSRILAQPTNNLGASPVPPAQFTSAVAYFEGRPPTVLDDSRGILHHHMTIYPRSQAKDFPRRPRCWAARVNEVTQQDWDTFLRHLFPPHLGLAASSQHLPRQLRAEIQRDRKDRPQETDDERRARITAVVAEWNQCFFEPRATRIFFVYVAEPDAAPASALCPKCYPATTKVNQSAQPQGAAGSPVVSSPGQSNTVSPVPGQYTPSPTTNPWPGQPVPPFAHPGGPATRILPAAATIWGVPPWGWNHWGYQQPQYQIPGASKGGAFGWISSLASQAQKYGERFSEQAQQYGDQISAQAQHYSRQVEEQALAHARWLEEQARLREQKRAFPFGGNSGRPPWGQYPLEGYGIPMTPISNPSPQNEVSSENRNSNDQPPLEREAPAAERPRRGSVSSTSSESSLSSIDSLSTTSDLNASDLATVRAQLQALDDRHDRTLYDAAVDLRRQLSVLQESRHEARVSPRRGWLHGRRHHPHHNHHHQQNPHDWGRWESPEQQQRNSTERRAMKEEMRATRKAFKEVFRRARDEQREQKRARRRQHGRHRSDNGDQPKPEDQPLDRRLESLALDGSTESGTVSTPSESALHTQKPLPTAPPAQSVPGIESSGPSSPSGSQIRSQDSQSDSVAGKKGKSNEAPARLKEILKPRKKQRQQQQSTAAPSASSDVDDADANKTVKKDPSPQ
ncbi:hypothetical protein N7474_008058 [Penicillium riverlandense]|uniref:uncharacterized protein n=1 Tax=Penicillium riverlandense TaxID=1903569 RepID=UPI002549BA5E|nr:uncharacterized protein N7474_008058 [Penicillium riverlandense]KAJ5811757.1 hypothetical protein N7474_008058 [Penicillium riverlandense]